MRKAILALALWIAGCAPPAVRACDEQIKSRLLAPATYQRVSASVHDTFGGKSVYVEYDAKNAAGVPIRSTGSCLISNDDLPAL